MDKKPYELGIIVGRFQTFHTGHEYMIRKAVELCDTVGVFIGSAQESATFKNPFSYLLREEMLRKVFGNALKIYPLLDIGVGNNSKWGDYVLENVEKRFGRKPDLLVSGKEERRIDWFDSVAGVTISELYVPKLIDISASEMRDFFLKNDREAYRKYAPEALWDQFDRLRLLMKTAQNYKETASI